MSRIKKYFESNVDNSIDKWHHYFDIYEFWFNKYRNKPIIILEIGVFQGGSLNLWREYFGKQAKIYAIDINPLCKQFETEGTKIFIGSQDDRIFLDHVKTQMPKADIIIDDGGHTMEQQIVSFESLYPHVKDKGLYLCEDLHTSYWPNYGGGYKNEGSFVEYSKNFIDKINAWHSQNDKLKVDQFTLSAYGIHFYDSIIIIEKKYPIAKPKSERKGKVIIPIQSFYSSSKTEKKLDFAFRNSSRFSYWIRRIKEKFIKNFK